MFAVDCYCQLPTANWQPSTKIELKKKPNKNGIIYSTDPDFKTDEEQAEVDSLAPAQQTLLVLLDKRNRAGKSVTLVQGFVGRQTDLDQLGKSLKSLCGTGGSVKDGEVIIQGDHRDKILAWLQKNGYAKTKKR